MAARDVAVVGEPAGDGEEVVLAAGPAPVGPVDGCRGPVEQPGEDGTGMVAIGAGCHQPGRIGELHEAADGEGAADLLYPYRGARHRPACSIAHGDHAIRHAMPLDAPLGLGAPGRVRFHAGPGQPVARQLRQGHLGLWPQIHHHQSGAVDDLPLLAEMDGHLEHAGREVLGRDAVGEAGLPVLVDGGTGLGRRGPGRPGHLQAHMADAGGTAGGLGGAQPAGHEQHRSLAHRHRGVR